MIVFDILASLMLAGFLWVWHTRIMLIPVRVRTMSWFCWFPVAIIMGVAIWW